MSNVAYVFFNKDTGDVFGVGNEKDETQDYITVEAEQIVPLLDGSEPMSNYVVQYNPKKKDLEFVSKFEHVLDAFTVKDTIYEIPTLDVGDADLTVTQDVPNSCWKVELGKTFKQNLRSKGVSLNANVMLSVTEKNDPNILYKTLFVDFNRLVNENYFILPFTMEFENVDTPVSVYTSKRFDTYQFKRIYE